MAETTQKSTQKATQKATQKSRQTARTSASTQNGKARTRSRSAPSAQAAPKPAGTKVAAGAAQQLAELTDKEVEGVTGLQRTDDGWTVEVELLELRRVPTTTDVLATYEVEVDPSGDLVGYRRARRYVRGQAEGGS